VDVRDAAQTQRFAVPRHGLARRVQRHHEPGDLRLALVLALPFKQEHRFVQRCTYAMSFTALKVARVEPAKTDVDQVRILRPLWVGSRRS